MADKRKRFSERTTEMMKNFISDRVSGLSIPEIAQKYSISDQTVYNRLNEIAKIEGISGGRDALLDIVRIRVSEARWQQRHEETKKSLNGIKEDIIQTKASTENLLKELNKILEEEI